MAAVVQNAQRVQRSIAFRARTYLRHITWWLRWGWRPYGVYHRYAMNRLARQDPQRAVGGLWDHLGPLQLDVLKAHGLRPEHKLLDIGCGSLRGGRHVMRYLEPGNYWGLDISDEILAAARRLVEDEALADREPHLHRTEGFTFREVEGVRFDFVQAFAVFTDVPMDYVDECFANLGKVLAPGGTFVATYVPGERYQEDRARIGFQYPMAMLEAIGQRHGYQLEPVREFQHPRGHRMFIAMSSEPAVYPH